MPTKKKRVQIIPDNLPALTTPQETCPSLFTGTSLAKKDPEKYARVVQKLAEGVSMNRISKTEKLSPGTVAAISKREQRTVEAVQTYTAGLNNYASQLCLERIIEKLESDEMPAGVLPVTFGILRDKEKNDLGQATSVVEHKTTITIDEVRQELEQMKQGAIEAEVEN